MTFRTLIIDPESILYTRPKPDIYLYAYLESLGIKPRHPQIVQKALKAAAFDVIHGRISRNDFYDAILRFHGVEESELAVGREAVLRDSFNLQSNPEMIGVLALMSQAGVKLVLVVNSEHSAEEIVDSLEQIGFHGNLWSAVIVSSDINLALPEQGMFEHVLGILGQHSQENIFMTAQVHNLPPMAAHGLTIIGFGLAQESPYAHHQVYSLPELSELLNTR